MEKKLFIIKELERRINKKNNSKFIGGNELKSIRAYTNSSQTNFYNNVLTLSYWSRVESGQIVPKEKYVREVLNQNDVDLSRIDFKSDFYEKIKKSVDAFINDNDDELNKLAGESRNGILTKSRIISFIDYLKKYDLFNASEDYYFLQKTISTMSDYDFIVYSIFSGIYYFMYGDFELALDVFNTINVFKLDYELELLRKIYIFYINCFNMQDDAIVIYDELYFELCSKRQEKHCELLSYYIGIFFCKKKMKIGYEIAKERLVDKKHILSLEIIYDFYVEGNVSKIDINTKDLSDYALCLKLIGSNKSFINKTLANHQGKIELDFDYHIIAFYNQTETAKCDYLEEIAGDIAYTNNEWIKFYFLDYIIEWCYKRGRYKRIYSFYKKVFNK